MCPRYAYAGGSRPNAVRAEAPRRPIVMPTGVLPATTARRWAHIGLKGSMESVGGGLAPLDPTRRHRPGRPSVYEAPSDGHAGWVQTNQGPATKPALVWTPRRPFGTAGWPRRPTGLVHCGWGQSRPLYTSHQPLRGPKFGRKAAVGILFPRNHKSTRGTRGQFVVVLVPYRHGGSY